MINASLTMVAKSLRCGSTWLVLTAMAGVLAITPSLQAQLITADQIKAASKQIDLAAAEQKTADKGLTKATSVAKDAAAELDAARQSLVSLQDKMAKAAPADKEKLATKIQAENKTIATLDAAKAKGDQDLAAAKQRLTAATQKTLDATTAHATLETNYAAQLKKSDADKAAAALKAKADKETAAKLEADKAAAAKLAKAQEAQRAEALAAQKEAADKLAAKAKKDLDAAQHDLTKADANLQDAKNDLAAAAAADQKAQAIVKQDLDQVSKATTPDAKKSAEAGLKKAQKNAATTAADLKDATAASQKAQAAYDQKLAAVNTLSPEAARKVAAASKAAAPAAVAAAPAAVAAAVAPAPVVAAEPKSVPPPALNPPATAAAKPAAAAKPVAATAAPKALVIPAAKTETVAGPFVWGSVRPAQPTPGNLAGEKPITVDPAAIAPVPTPDGADKFQFDVAIVSGDKAIVEKLDAWKEWSEHITFNPVTVVEIQAFHTKLMKALAQEGFVFANVTFPTRVWNNGIFLAKVDGGPLGTITSIKGNRYYSAAQIVKNLSRPGLDRFDYTTIYGDLFDLNAKPDVQVNMHLKPVIQDGRRVMNAELDVKDSLPIHGSVELSNTGTKMTNDWRIHSTVSHYNLTKHDDVLTLDWITSPQLADVNSWSGGYFLPIDREYSLSLFGGWSNSDVQDVMPLLDVRGTGYFGGAQVTKTYAEDNKRRIQLSAGWLYQRFQNKYDVADVTLDNREVVVSSPNFTIGWADKQLDSMHGRNYFSNTVLASFGGQMASSETGDANAQGWANSQDNVIVDKFQLTRFQRLFSGNNEPGKWTLMAKLDGQLPSDPLTAGLKRSIGGANSVRGYREQEEAFDEAYVANFELYTPLLQNFIPGMKKTDEFLTANPEAWQQHRLLFLVFADVGYGKNQAPAAGELKDDTLYSVGAGLRLGLTKYSNLRFDYGIPLSATVDSGTHAGRAHIALQLQF